MCHTRPRHHFTEVLATSPQYASRLQYRTELVRRISHLQRETVRTKKFDTNHSLRVPQCPRTFWPITYIIDDKGVILLATDDQCNTNVLQELQVMPAIQSGHLEAGRTVLTIRGTEDAVGVNPHRLCNGAPRGQWVQNHHDVRRPIQKNGSASTIT